MTGVNPVDASHARSWTSKAALSPKTHAKPDERQYHEAECGVDAKEGGFDGFSFSMLEQEQDSGQGQQHAGQGRPQLPPEEDGEYCECQEMQEA